MFRRCCAAVALQDALGHKIAELDLMVIVSIDGGSPREAVETWGFGRVALSKVVYTNVGHVAIHGMPRTILFTGKPADVQTLYPATAFWDG